MNSLAAELEAALAAQERQIAERTDERAEAELRVSVGEFAGKEWDKLRGKLDSAIALISGRARFASARIPETLRALLSEAEPSANGASAPAGDVDDIAFLRSVLGGSTPYSTTPPPASEPPVVERAPARVSVPGGEASVGAGRADRRGGDGAVARASCACPSPAVRRAGRGARIAGSCRAAPGSRAGFGGGTSARACAGAGAQARCGAAARVQGTAPARPSGSATIVPPRNAAPELFTAPEVAEAPSGPRATDDERPGVLSVRELRSASHAAGRQKR